MTFFGTSVLSFGLGTPTELKHSEKSFRTFKNVVNMKVFLALILAFVIFDNINGAAIGKKADLEVEELDRSKYCIINFKTF